jgi:predicted house-cleaning noncanonical NTP pyrophosphatase (MazG superfamily)
VQDDEEEVEEELEDEVEDEVEEAVEEELAEVLALASKLVQCSSSASAVCVWPRSRCSNLGGGEGVGVE